MFQTLVVNDYIIKPVDEKLKKLPKTMLTVFFAIMLIAMFIVGSAL